jgi:site-specific DNA-methyltransferase (adenine-specific)
MAELQPESIDLILTSPPYWGLRTYGQPHNADIMREWLAESGDGSGSPSYEWYRVHGGILGMEPIPEWFVDHLVEIIQRASLAEASGSTSGIPTSPVGRAFDTTAARGSATTLASVARPPWVATVRRSNS